MALVWKNILQDKKGARHFAKLYRQAFPRCERAPLWALKKNSQGENGDCFALYDGEAFVGLVSTVKHKDLLFLFFLAVDKDKRNRGYGSQILQELEVAYPTHRRILCIEDPDEVCREQELRQRRQGFYARNGYTSLGWRVNERGIVYLMLGAHDARAHEFKEMMIAYLGEKIYGKVYREP